jgi:hypothetical protein
MLEETPNPPTAFAQRMAEAQQCAGSIDAEFTADVGAMVLDCAVQVRRTWNAPSDLLEFDSTPSALGQ